jgi:DNA-binding NtrC family response regulator
MTAVSRGALTRTLPGGKASVRELVVEGLEVHVVSGPDAGRLAALTQNSLMVGTDTDNDLVLTDPTVSRRHLMISLQDHRVQVEDLGSKNGTTIGGVSIRVAFVPDGARVQVGGTELCVTLAPSKVSYIASTSSSFHGLVGQSVAMRELFALIERVAMYDLPVHVFGESGVGKELVARAIHDASPRRDRPYRILDCGSVVADLLPSQLFGFEQGAFTGADHSHAGILEEAAAGTVVLDEVGEIPLSVQPRLLRALETREIQRLAGKKAIQTRFRLVSCTNRDLKEAVGAGQFRADLYYRLVPITVRIPSLRERAEDIPLLVDHFAREWAERHGVKGTTFSPQAVRQLGEVDWPGNVRELRNAVQSLAVLYPGVQVSLEQVQRSLAKSPPPVGERPSVDLEKVERAAIVDALNQTGWKKAEAAKLLGIARTTLYYKIGLYGLKKIDSSK